MASRGATGERRMKPYPTFHIPVGPKRDKDGKVVLFKSDDERNEPHGRFMQALMTHPAALAAGGFVMIGPTRTQCVDLKGEDRRGNAGGGECLGAERHLGFRRALIRLTDCG
jgi:hypothetical protein